MKIRRNHYIAALILLLGVGATGVIGGSAPILISLFFCCLVLFMGGVLSEVDNRIENHPPYDPQNMNSEHQVTETKPNVRARV